MSEGRFFCHKERPSDILVYSLFTIYMPRQTSIRDTKLVIPIVEPSFNIIADKITPQTGFIKPNTATLEIGLCFKRSPQSE